MLYICTHMTTVGVKWLTTLIHNSSQNSKCYDSGMWCVLCSYRRDFFSVKD